MAKSSIARAAVPRKLRFLASPILFGPAVALLQVLVPASASAQGCFLANQVAPPVSPTSLQPIAVTVDGELYNLCTVYGSFSAFKAVLTDQKSAPWYTNGASEAAAFAQAITASYASEITLGGQSADKPLNRLYYQINNGPISNGAGSGAGSGNSNGNDNNSNGNGKGNRELSSAYLLWADASRPNGRLEWVSAYQPSNGNSGYKINSKFKPAPDENFWYFYADDPVPGPGPLPVLGAGAAFALARRLRRRVREATPLQRPLEAVSCAGSER